MKIINFFFIILSLLTTLSCKKEKEEIDDEDMPQTYATYLIAKYFDPKKGDLYADSALIFIYKIEVDYLSNKNEIVKEIMKRGQYKIKIN